MPPKPIIIRTQTAWDSLPARFETDTSIVVDAKRDRIVINRQIPNAYITIAGWTRATITVPCTVIVRNNASATITSHRVCVYLYDLACAKSAVVGHPTVAWNHSRSHDE